MGLRFKSIRLVDSLGRLKSDGGRGYARLIDDRPSVTNLHESKDGKDDSRASGQGFFRRLNRLL